jgi:hypothetical protein
MGNKSNKSTNNDIVKKYDEIIEELVTFRPLVPISDRNLIIEALNSEYMSLTGNNLPSFLLSRLADWILLEVLNDRDVDKVTNNEFAILSPRQIKRRDKREYSFEAEIIDYLNLKYVNRKDSLSKKNTKELE